MCSYDVVGGFCLLTHKEEGAVKSAWTNACHTWTVTIASSVSPEGGNTKPRVFCTPAELWLCIKSLLVTYERHSQQRQLHHVDLLTALEIVRVGGLSFSQ